MGERPNEHAICSDHYICIIMSPKKWGQIFILDSLDSADRPEGSYQDIIDLIQAYVMQALT